MPYNQFTVVLGGLIHIPIIIKTDSYYRNNLFIRLLSIFLHDVYDRPLSIKKKELNKTLRCVYNK